MSRQTTNYGLTKPDYTDTADIEVINSNMDIIDNALKVIDTKAQNVMSKNSSAWSSTTTYTVGQYCIYNNSLWKCLVQHSGQTPQEGTYWTRVSLDTLGSEISVINQNLARLVCQNIHLINSDETLNGNYVMIAEYILRQIESRQTSGYFSGTIDINGAWFGFFGYNTSSSFGSDYAFIQLFQYKTAGNTCYRYSNYGGTIYELD